MVGQKKCFLRITLLDSKLGYLSIFLLGFEFLRFFELSNSLITHLYQKLVERGASSPAFSSSVKWLVLQCAVSGTIATIGDV